MFGWMKSKCLMLCLKYWFVAEFGYCICTRPPYPPSCLSWPKFTGAGRWFGNCNGLVDGIPPCLDVYGTFDSSGRVSSCSIDLKPIGILRIGTAQSGSCLSCTDLRLRLSWDWAAGIGLWLPNKFLRDICMWLSFCGGPRLRAFWMEEAASLLALLRVLSVSLSLLTPLRAGIDPRPLAMGGLPWATPPGAASSAWLPLTLSL